MSPVTKSDLSLKIRHNLLAIKSALGLKNNHQLAAILGVKDGTLTYWLSGFSHPDLTLLVALAGRLGITSAHLTGEIEMTPEIMAEIVQKVVVYLPEREGA